MACIIRSTRIVIMLKRTGSIFFAALAMLPSYVKLPITTSIVLSATPLAISTPAANAQGNDLYLKKAVIKYKKGDYQGALTDVKQAIEMNPGDASAYSLMGLIKTDQGDLNGAINAYTRSIEIDPSKSTPYYFRGKVRMKNEGDLNKIANLGDRQKDPTYRRRKMAIDDFTKAITINPNDSDYYLHRALAKHLIEESEGGIEDLSKAIKISPQESKLYQIRGWIKKAVADLNGACLDYKIAAKLGGKNARNWFDVECSNNVNASDLDKDNEELRAHLLWNSGVKKEKSGDDEGAIEDFTKAIKINPLNKRAYNSRALTRAKSGDFRGAIEDYTRGLEIDSEDPLMYRNRGVNKSKINDHEGAIVDFSKAIEITPNDSIAYALRGMQKRILGRVASACEDMKKSSDLGLHEATDFYAESCQ